jgi:urate oxidase
MASIAAARYGKDNVRVYKVERDEKTGVQTVTEMTVCVLLEGAIEPSYVCPSHLPTPQSDSSPDIPEQTTA